MKKIYLTFFIIMNMLIIGQTCTMAVQQQTEFKGIEQAIDSKLVKTSAPILSQTPTYDNGMDSVISTITGVVAYICYAAAFIVVLIQGVRFMTASPEGKAEIKKRMTAVVVGGVIVFAIGGILQIISNLTKAIF